ncbi:hypothetical protein HK096_008060 [Nowakowskiella sp. JEL0078]|nr:hypothetical protein HK096_008060 [Nowakowskiella sp. JEL0078]
MLNAKIDHVSPRRVTSLLILALTSTASPLVRRIPQPTSGSLRLLSYNVAGLPAILSSGTPDKSTALIGQKIAPFDIVHVEEDFNCKCKETTDHHATLYANDVAHAYRTATSGGAGIGSGLNSLLKYPFDDFERVKWNDCYGVLSNSNDCLTPKGFTFMRVRIAEGVYIDFYNLHTDADTQEGDLNARRKNIEQLSNYINTVSAGQAVVVMGDTNTRYTRDGDNPRLLTTANGLTDVWVQLILNGVAPTLGADAIVCPDSNPPLTCEVVDKIFYRGSRALSITPINWTDQNSNFLNTDGSKLSDHYPIGSDITWSTVGRGILLSDQIGGPHGNFYTDVVTLPTDPSKVQIVSFTLRGGSRVDAVSVTRAPSNGAATETLTHGGSGGSPVTLTLTSGEYVVSATFSQGKTSTTRVFYAKLVTNTGRSISVGTSTSDSATYTAPSGMRIVGFWGRSGDEVDKVGVIYANV